MYQLTIGDVVMTVLLFRCTREKEFEYSKLQPAFMLQVTGLFIRFLPRLYALINQLRLMCQIPSKSRFNNLLCHHNRKIKQAVQTAYKSFFADPYATTCEQELEDKYLEARNAE